MSIWSSWGRRLVALPGASAFATFVGSVSWPSAQTFLNGIGFGSAEAPGGATDLSRHIALFGTTYGFSITTGSLNYVVNSGAAHKFYVGSTNVATLDGTTLSLLQGQLKFPASQNASSDANTLDDYEEGTFTPTITGSTTAGTGTYSVQTGLYTKVGNLVTITARCTWSTHDGTGNLRMSGLPFSVATLATPASIRTFGIPYTGSLQAFVQGSLITLEQLTEAGTQSAIAMDTAGDFIVSATYRTS